MLYNICLAFLVYSGCIVFGFFDLECYDDCVLREHIKHHTKMNTLFTALLVLTQLKATVVLILRFKLFTKLW